MGSSRIYSSRTKTEPFEGYPGPIVDYALDHDLALHWAVGHMPPAVPSVLDLSRGEWTAPLPEGTPVDVANNPDQGVLREPPQSEWRQLDVEHFGSDLVEQMTATLDCRPDELISVPKASLVLFAAEWAIDYLASTPSGVALVREMNPSPDSRTVIWDSPIGAFYPVSWGSIGRDGFANLMDQASSVSGELVLLTTSQLDVAQPRRLQGDDLTALFSEAGGIILGAYDGEGYVRWRRSRTV